MGYSDSRNFIEISYYEICQFMPSGLIKLGLMMKLKNFRAKVLGQDGTAIYRSVTITDDDKITSVGIFFIDLDTFRNKQVLKFRLNKALVFYLAHCIYSILLKIRVIFAYLKTYNHK